MHQFDLMQIVRLCLRSGELRWHEDEAARDLLEVRDVAGGRGKVP